MSGQTNEPASRKPFYVIYVQRPGDEEPWVWGGDYDDPTGANVMQRISDLGAEYPDYLWSVKQVSR